jgi:DNA-binding MarR family transcriptional regulator
MALGTAWLRLQDFDCLIQSISRRNQVRLVNVDGGAHLEITATERRVIDVLVKYGKSRNAFEGPIHAVDQAMRWETTASTRFVEDLERRGLIVRKIHAFNRMEEGTTPPPMSSWWERP